jgi:hypothetical protein
MARCYPIVCAILDTFRIQPAPAGAYGLWLEGHRSAVQSEAVYLMKKSPAFFRRGTGWEEAGRRMCF